MRLLTDPGPNAVSRLPSPTFRQERTAASVPSLHPRLPNQIPMLVRGAVERSQALGSTSPVMPGPDLNAPIGNLPNAGLGVSLSASDMQTPDFPPMLMPIGPDSPPFDRMQAMSRSQLPFLGLTTCRNDYQRRGAPLPEFSSPDYYEGLFSQTPKFGDGLDRFKSAHNSPENNTNTTTWLRSRSLYESPKPSVIGQGSEGERRPAGTDSTAMSRQTSTAGPSRVRPTRRSALTFAGRSNAPREPHSQTSLLRHTDEDDEIDLLLSRAVSGLSAQDHEKPGDPGPSTRAHWEGFKKD